MTSVMLGEMKLREMMTKEELGPPSNRLVRAAKVRRLAGKTKHEKVTAAF
jgi:hypothetical protein